MRALFLLLSLQLVSNPQISSAQEVRFQADNVVVLKTQDGLCGLFLSSIVKKRGEANLTLIYNATKKEVKFSLSSEITTSLDPAGVVDLELVFIAGGRYDDAWGDVSFVYYEDNGVWHFTETFSDEGASDILDDIARSTHLALQYRGDPFTGAKLSNSAAAIAALRKCAYDQAGLNLNDPFAK
jgi:hypothetical protein